MEPFILKGVASAVRSANYVARTAIQALEDDDFSEASLKGYQDLWEKKLEPQLKALQGIEETAADAEALNRVFAGLNDNHEAVARVFGD
ncbi:MAG: hypothetical protein SWK76_11015 [Actinomycetota bacterium]|nr:hypothetical protein [Actinomycetota bacterium]